MIRKYSEPTLALAMWALWTWFCWQGSLGFPSGQVCEISEHTGYEHCSTYRAIFAPFVEAGLFVEHHNGAFLVIFTLLLAAYAGGLWRETHLLAIGAEKSAKTAERALTQLERPHLRVRIIENRFKILCDMFASGSLQQSMRGTVRVIFRNYGKYPAFTKRCHFSVFISASPPSGPGTLTQLSGDPIIAPDGETVGIEGIVKGPYNAVEAAEIANGIKKIWVLGSLTYGNVVGIGDEFVTDFLWVYDRGTDTWSPSDVGGPERNRSN